MKRKIEIKTKTQKNKFIDSAHLLMIRYIERLILLITYIFISSSSSPNYYS